MSERVFSMDCNADGSAVLHWKGSDITMDPEECRAFLDLAMRAAIQFREMRHIELHGWPQPRRWWQFWRARINTQADPHR
jgi:hypothetical protein